MSTYFLPAPCDPVDAALSIRTGRSWTVLHEGEPTDPPPRPMPLNYARHLQREWAKSGRETRLALLTRNQTMDGTFWTWEPPHEEPSGPIRIRRERTKGWRKPPNAVIVDRTSRWGNPFTVDMWNCPKKAARAFAAHTFAAWLDGETTTVQPERRERILRELPTLRGRDLVCFCPIDYTPCHGDELILRANRGAV